MSTPIKVVVAMSHPSRKERFHILPEHFVNILRPKHAIHRIAENTFIFRRVPYRGQSTFLLGQERCWNPGAGARGDTRPFPSFAVFPLLIEPASFTPGR